MCIFSTLLNTLYGLLLVVALGLSVTSLVLPNWSSSDIDYKGVRNGTITKGILFGCKVDIGKGFDLHGLEVCSEDRLNKLTPTEWVTVGGYFICIACCVLGIIWTIINGLACCCRKCLAPPLMMFAGVAFLALAIGVITFGIKHGDDVGPIPTSTTGVEAKITGGKIGAGFWLGVICCIVLLADTIIATVLNFCVKIPLA